MLNQGLFLKTKALKGFPLHELRLCSASFISLWEVLHIICLVIVLIVLLIENESLHLLDSLFLFELSSLK